MNNVSFCKDTSKDIVKRAKSTVILTTINGILFYQERLNLKGVVSGF